MRNKMLLIALLVAAVAVYFIYFHKSEEPNPGPPVEKQKPVAQSKYSAAFNESVGQALAAYETVQERLVNWDSAGVTPAVDGLQQRLDALSFDELQKDTAIHQTAVSYKENFSNDLAGMRNAPNFEESRRAFHSLSQNLYDLLRVIRYDGSAIFLQECPMAFNDDESAVWLSKTRTVRNPYLGLHHPLYKKSMLTCGGPKDSIQFATNP